MAKGEVRKAVLAYSGGLDTSVILHWLHERYGCDLVAFIADLGQGEDMEAIASRARASGASEVRLEDLREIFVRDYVFPMLRANALYEGSYLLGTAIARPLIARRQLEIAEETGADALAHGATGKGNDQLRFELSYAAWNPDIRVIAPWREWEMSSRRDLMDYARARQISLPEGVEEEPPFSCDANLLHHSTEGKVLEDVSRAAPPEAYRWTVSPEDAPSDPLDLSIDFARGDPVALDGASLSGAELLSRLNGMGSAHGVGRVDMVENRSTGMKSRGVYETPGGTILLAARRALESLTLDAGAMHLKASLMPRYASLIYDGLWFSPERRMLQALMDESQASVGGRIVVRLYRGVVSVVGRESGASLYSSDLASFDDGVVYDHGDAAGFIRLRGLRLGLLARRRLGGKD